MAQSSETPAQQPAHEQYPEVVQPRRAPAPFNMFDSSWEHYEVEDVQTPDYPPQRSPAPEYMPHRSPAPEYQPFSPGRSLPSPQLSSTGSPPPPLSTDGISHSRSASHQSWGHPIRTPATTYSEFQSPHPEAVFKQVPRYRVEKAQPSTDPEAIYPSKAQYVSDDKEYVNNAEQSSTLAPSYTVKRKPLPSEPVVEEVKVEKQPEKRKRPIYKRPLVIILAVIAIIAIGVGVACGVIFGTKKPAPSPQPFVITGDPDLAVGGYLNPSYYSTIGAFNGSGIAIAAANPGVDRTTYVFYQDYTGIITFKLINVEGRLEGPLGTVSSVKPLNGTPISVVNHSPAKGSQAYHIFYIDQNYTMVERILRTTGDVSSAIPVWQDGTLNDKKLKTMKSTSIGMQACYNNDFYGAYNNNYINATNSIQLWFATAENTFTQYNWTNGTSPWTYARNWTDLNTHPGVGCQTWDSWMLEYVFFVNKTQSIVAYWRDNNRTAAANTATHPTLRWNQIPNIDISNVHKSSSLGYTTYLLYQHEDHSIRGVNMSWAAENSTVNLRYGTTSNDVFTVEDTQSDDPVAAIGGTHLSITAIKTSSNGAELQVYLQQQGNEVRQYTRDMVQVNGKWAPGLKIVG